MRKIIREFAVVGAALIVLIAGFVAVAVTKARSAGAYNVQTTVSVRGEQKTTYHYKMFPSEEACKMFMRSAIFMRDLEMLGAALLAADENATFVDEPACHEVVQPDTDSPPAATEPGDPS